jgi:hypothetical protein
MGGASQIIADQALESHPQRLILDDKRFHDTGSAI